MPCSFVQSACDLYYQSNQNALGIENLLVVTIASILRLLTLHVGTLDIVSLLKSSNLTSHVVDLHDGISLYTWFGFFLPGIQILQICILSSIKNNVMLVPYGL